MTRPEDPYEAASYDLNKFRERRLADRRFNPRATADRRANSPNSPQPETRQEPEQRPGDPNTKSRE